MPNKIQVDYEQLKHISEGFNLVGASIGAWMGRIETAVEELPNTWKGRAANQFFSDWDPIKHNIRKTLEALDTARTQILAIVTIFADAEAHAKGKFGKNDTDVFSSRH